MSVTTNLCFIVRFHYPSYSTTLQLCAELNAEHRNPIFGSAYVNTEGRMVVDCLPCELESVILGSHGPSRGIDIFYLAGKKPIFGRATDIKRHGNRLHPPTANQPGGIDTLIKRQVAARADLEVASGVSAAKATLVCEDIC